MCITWCKQSWTPCTFYLTIERNQIDLIQPSQVKHIGFLYSRYIHWWFNSYMYGSCSVIFLFISVLEFYWDACYTYTWRAHYVVVRRYICLFSWIGLVTSPYGNQVEWMCNGKKNFLFFFLLRNVRFVWTDLVLLFMTVCISNASFLFS